MFEGFVGKIGKSALELWKEGSKEDGGYMFSKCLHSLIRGSDDPTPESLAGAMLVQSELRKINASLDFLVQAIQKIFGKK